MHDEGRPVIQCGEKVFRPTLEALDPATLKPSCETLGKWEAEIRPPLIDPRECCADEDRRQTAADSLDLGEFRQAKCPRSTGF
jgi:hypothetical protein